MKGRQTQSYESPNSCILISECSEFSAHFLLEMKIFTAEIYLGHLFQRNLCMKIIVELSDELFSIAAKR